jgi:hypothetical protein
VKRVCKKHASVARHVLVFTPVLPQAPLVLSSRFVEAMFVLHGVRSHPEYASAVAEMDATASDSGTPVSPVCIGFSARVECDVPVPGLVPVPGTGIRVCPDCR